MCVCVCVCVCECVCVCAYVGYYTYYFLLLASYPNDHIHRMPRTVQVCTRSVPRACWRAALFDRSPRIGTFVPCMGFTHVRHCHSRAQAMVLVSSLRNDNDKCPTTRVDLKGFRRRPRGKSSQVKSSKWSGVKSIEWGEVKSSWRRYNTARMRARSR